MESLKFIPLPVTPSASTETGTASDGVNALLLKLHMLGLNIKLIFLTVNILEILIVVRLLSWLFLHGFPNTPYHLLLVLDSFHGDLFHCFVNLWWLCRLVVDTSYSFLIVCFIKK